MYTTALLRPAARTSTSLPFPGGTGTGVVQGSGTGVAKGSPPPPPIGGNPLPPIGAGAGAGVLNGRKGSAENSH